MSCTSLPSSTTTIILIQLAAHAQWRSAAIWGNCPGKIVQRDLSRIIIQEEVFWIGTLPRKNVRDSREFVWRGNLSGKNINGNWPVEFPKAEIYWRISRRKCSGQFSEKCPGKCQEGFLGRICPREMAGAWFTHKQTDRQADSYWPAILLAQPDELIKYFFKQRKPKTSKSYVDYLFTVNNLSTINWHFQDAKGHHSEVREHVGA